MRFKIITHTILIEYDHIWRFKCEDVQKPKKIKWKQSYVTTVKRILSFDRVGAFDKYKVTI